MRRQHTEAGFTLVELMVVVLVIGILVAIAIPIFNTAVATARTRTCQHNLRTLDGIVEQYKAANPNHNIVTRWGGTTSNRSLAASGSLIADLTPHVKDWNAAAYCPKGGRYHVRLETVVGGPQGEATFICEDHGDSY